MINNKYTLIVSFRIKILLLDLFDPIHEFYQFIWGFGQIAAKYGKNKTAKIIVVFTKPDKRCGQ